MSIDRTIKAAIEPIVPVCLPNLYDPGDDEARVSEYCTFNYSEVPTSFGDDAPMFVRYLVQLHWYLPTGANPFARKQRIKKALFDAGFTYPEVTNAGYSGEGSKSGQDHGGQHYVFECELAEGVDDGEL
nr:MAG TPA: Protein of unknown function (DUF806) [Caudoviricetes sp.]